jgi:ankyrin repeat protein
MGSSGGWAALHLACANKRLEVVKVFIARGAGQQILCRDSKGSTPLSLTFKRPRTAEREALALLLLQQLLLQPDFDINHPTLVLQQPLLYTAAFTGYCRGQSGS